MSPIGFRNNVHFIFFYLKNLRLHNSYSWPIFHFYAPFDICSRIKIFYSGIMPYGPISHDAAIKDFDLQANEILWKLVFRELRISNAAYLSIETWWKLTLLFTKCQLCVCLQCHASFVFLAPESKLAIRNTWSISVKLINKGAWEATTRNKEDHVISNISLW